MCVHCKYAMSELQFNELTIFFYLAGKLHASLFPFSFQKVERLWNPEYHFVLSYWGSSVNTQNIGSVNNISGLSLIFLNPQEKML